MGLIFVCIVVYGWMFIDIKTALFARYDLDYSTHTAAALGLILFLVPSKRPSLDALLLLSFFMYLGLMKYLHYHTWLDMGATALLVCVFLSPLVFLKRAAA
jgi:hypothetical protein